MFMSGVIVKVPERVQFWLENVLSGAEKENLTLVPQNRIVLHSNGCAVITPFWIYLKRVMTDPFTFGCRYSLLDHVKLKLQS